MSAFKNILLYGVNTGNTYREARWFLKIEMCFRLLWPTSLFAPSFNGHRLLSSVFMSFLLLPRIQTFGCSFSWLSVDLLLIFSHLICCNLASQIMKSIRTVYKIRLLIKVRARLSILMLLLQDKVHGLYDSFFTSQRPPFSYFPGCSLAERPV